MIWQLREQLMDEIPEFGVHLGYNGKVLQSYSSRQVMKCKGVKGRTLDSDADWAGMGIAVSTTKPASPGARSNLGSVKSCT